MTTPANVARAAAANSTRARAYAEILAALGQAPPPLSPVHTWGARAVDAVIALESAFDIGIDVDEVMGLRLTALLDLVEARATAAGPRLEGRTVFDPQRGVFLFPDRPARACDSDPIPPETPPAPAPANWRGRARLRGPLLSARGRHALTVGACFALAALAYAAAFHP